MATTSTKLIKATKNLTTFKKKKSSESHDSLMMAAEDIPKPRRTPLRIRLYCRKSTDLPNVQTQATRLVTKQKHEKLYIRIPKSRMLRIKQLSAAGLI